MYHRKFCFIKKVAMMLVLLFGLGVFHIDAHAVLVDYYSWVHYCANGGTFSDGKHEVKGYTHKQFYWAPREVRPSFIDLDITITSEVPVRKGYTFRGWAGFTSYEQDAKGSVNPSGVIYKAGQNVKVPFYCNFEYIPSQYDRGSDAYLTAVWERNDYLIKYYKKDGTSAYFTDYKFQYEDYKVKGYKREGYDFLGWSNNPDLDTVVYKEGDIITQDEPLSLYAVWKPHVYTIQYNANGGEGAPATVEKTRDIDLTISNQIPLRLGYRFLGWSTEEDAVNPEYYPGDLLPDKNLNLYAIWKDNIPENSLALRGPVQGSSGNQIKESLYFSPVDELKNMKISIVYPNFISFVGRENDYYSGIIAEEKKSGYNHILEITYQKEDGFIIGNTECLCDLLFKVEDSNVYDFGEYKMTIDPNASYFTNMNDESQKPDGVEGIVFQYLPTKATGLSLEAPLEIQEATQISADFTPDNTSSHQLTWSINDPGIAVVDCHGIVTPIKNGIVTVTATTTDGSNISNSIDIKITSQHNYDIKIQSDSGVWDKGFSVLDNNYNVYVGEDTTKIDFLVDFSSGYIMYDSAVYTSSAQLTVSFKEDETEKTFTVCKMENGYSDLNYTFTIHKKDKPENIVHNLKHFAAVPSTCIVKGNKEYWKCSDCRKLFADNNAVKEISIDEVTLDYGLHVRPSDDSKDHSFLCEVCNEVVTDSHISNNNTSFENGEDGLTHQYICDICEETVKENHEFENGICKKCDAISLEQCKNIKVEVEPVSYNGIFQTPTFVVKNGDQIVHPKYYNSIIPDSKNAGSHTFTLVGKGKYTDTKTVFWNIDRIDLKEEDFIFTLPENAIYDGNPKAAAATTTASGVGAYSLQYVATGGSIDELTNSAPVDAGTYDVYAVVENGENYNAAKLFGGTFSVGKGTVEAPSAPVIESYTDSSVTIYKDPEDDTVYEYKSSKYDSWQTNNVLKFLDAETTYTVYRRAKETANTKASESSAGTVCKTSRKRAEIVTAPEIKGNYGQTVEEMLKSGKAYCDITQLQGVWSVSDEDAEKILSVGTKDKIEVTFTPDEEGIKLCDPATIEVTPYIEPKNISVQIKNSQKKYGEDNPEFECETPTEGLLVGKDSLLDLNIQFKTEATATSDVGTYAVTGTGNSANYVVTVLPGTLTINKTDSKIVIAEAYQSYTKSYQDKTFSLMGVTVIGDGDLQYESDNENVVTVDEAGTVTVHDIGSATITLRVPETKNYKANSITIPIRIDKAAAIKEVVFEKRYFYNENSEDCIDVNKMMAEVLPSDCGEIQYSIASLPDGVSEDATISDSGKLELTVLSGESGRLEDVIINVTTKRYETSQFILRTKLVSEIPIELADDADVSLKSNSLIYGEKLSKLEFNETVFVNSTNNKVTGTLKWENPDYTPTTKDTEASWIFVPDQESYESKTGVLKIEVAKANPVVPVLEKSSIKCNENLTDIILPEGFSFENENETLKVGTTNKVFVCYTPDDIDNYNIVHNISHTVFVEEHDFMKEGICCNLCNHMMSFQVNDSVTGNGGIYTIISTEDSLKDESGNVVDVYGVRMDEIGLVSLSGSVSIPATVVMTYGAKEYLCVVREVGADCFSDYPFLSEINVPATVNRLCNRAFADCRYLRKVNYYGTDVPDMGTDVFLNSGSGVGWNDSESFVLLNSRDSVKQKIANAISGMANVKIAEEHLHFINEVKGYDATCTKAGLKTHYKCVDCSNLFKDSKGDTAISMESEVIISAKGHSYISHVEKEATENSTGTRRYVCSRDKNHTYTEVIPKIVNTDSGSTTQTDNPDSNTSNPSKGKTVKDDKGTAMYEVADVTGKEVVYKATADKNAKTITIPPTVTINDKVYKVTAIADKAFSGSSKLTTVTISSNVTTIGKNAFSGCKKLTKVTIGKNVKTIGASAFSGCRKLKTVSMGSNVTTIGDKAFYKCTALTKVTIPTKVNKIGKQAFYGCKNLKSITIKTTKLTSSKVGSKAFKGIYSKATIKVPKSKLKSYKTILKAKGVSSKAKIKK